MQGAGFRVQGSGCRVQGLSPGVERSGFGVCEMSDERPQVRQHDVCSPGGREISHLISQFDWSSLTFYALVSGAEDHRFDSTMSARSGFRVQDSGFRVRP